MKIITDQIKVKFQMHKEDQEESWSTAFAEIAYKAKTFFEDVGWLICPIFPVTPEKLEILQKLLVTMDIVIRCGEENKTVIGRIAKVDPEKGEITITQPSNWYSPAPTAWLWQKYSHHRPTFVLVDGSRSAIQDKGTVTVTVPGYARVLTESCESFRGSALDDLPIWEEINGKTAR